MFDRSQIVPVMNRLSEYHSREVEWLWPGRVPIGKVTLLCGDPGVGKSFVCMDMAARVSAGLGWPEEEGSGQWAVGSGEQRNQGALGVTCRPRVMPGSVLVMSAEDDPFDTLRPRVERAGGDLSRVVLLRAYQAIGVAGAWGMTLDDNVDVIQKALARLERPRLVVIDPVSAFLGRVNGYSNTAVRGVLDQLGQVAAQFHVAVVCVTHVNKTRGVAAAHRVMGSLAFAASPRMVWNVERRGERRGANDEQEACGGVMVAVKSNVGDVGGPIGFEVSRGRVLWRRAEVGEVEQVERVPGVLEQACRWLEAFLRTGWKPSAEVMLEGERAGISVSSLRRAREVCGVEVRREGRGWVWGLRGEGCGVATTGEISPDGLARSPEDH